MKSFFAIFGIMLTLAMYSLPVMAAPGDKGIGGALEIALPMGDFGDFAGTGIGVTGNFQYGWKPNIDLMAQLGYIKWGGKTITGIGDYSYSAIPIQVGGKYFFTQQANRFYVGGLVGFHMFSSKIDYDSPIFGTGSSSESETKLSLAPMGGYEMQIGQSMLLDISARYQFVSDDLSYFGVRGGIIYKLK